MPSIASVLIAAALSGATAAAPTGVEPAFGNTITSTYPDGRIARVWLEPGGGYVGQGRRGGRSSGRWSVKGERICLRQSRPFPFPKAYCAPVVKGGVGTSWPAKAVTGEPVTMTLVAGTTGR